MITAVSVLECPKRVKNGHNDKLQGKVSEATEQANRGESGTPEAQ